MVAILLGADNGFFYAGQIMHFSSPFTVFLIYRKQSDQGKQNASCFYCTACAAWSFRHKEMLCGLDSMEPIINGINIDVIKELTSWFCALHALEAGITSAPHPSVWQFKGYLVIDIFDHISYLLIIRDSHIFPL